ncbi:ParB-like nuclease domain protein [Mycobacterium phage prophiT37-1]|nr:ParB-like nuclease domain protein [Mycobacterium phage prophiT37-1]
MPPGLCPPPPTKVDGIHMAMTPEDLVVRVFAVTDLRTFAGNPRRGQVDAIVQSLSRHGQYRPIVVNAGTKTGRPMEVLAGNHTLLAARKLGWDTISATLLDVSEQQAKAIVAADNRLSDLGDYDTAELLALLEGLDELDGTGYTAADLEELASELTVPDGDGAVSDAKSTLASRFGVPPFTVLDAKQGAWKQRVKAWKALGIASASGRSVDTEGGSDARAATGIMAFKAPQSIYANWYEIKNAAEKKIGRTLTTAEIMERYGDELKFYAEGGAISVFDPVLAELLVSWFSPVEADVIDPWSGGSVRGVVSAALGRRYTGIDLSGDQLAVNGEQWAVVEPRLPQMATTVTAPQWIQGDSRDVLKTLDDESFDMMIGCPPYYDLEQYSKDPADLSAMSTDEFDAAFIETIAEVARVLRPDSFAALVVGSARDKRGDLRDMRSLVSRAAEATGMKLANDAVLLTAIGSNAARAARPFSKGRALGRVHQDILVLVKGDRIRAARRCGEEVTLIAEPELDEDGED